MNTLNRTDLHRELIEGLDAFIDEEWTPEGVERLRAHLSGSRRCQQALRLHRALRGRLAALPVPRRPCHRPTRSQNGLNNERRARDYGTSSGEHRHPRCVGRLRGWGGARCRYRRHLALVSAWGDTATQHLPMVQAALAGYRQHQSATIPATDPLQLALLERKLPSEERPLAGLSGQLVGAWQTTIWGEPAAAFAFRCQNPLLVQYVVSQSLFFLQPQIREAVSRRGRYTTTVREIPVLAGPQKDSGSILVGAVDPRLLEAICL